MLLRSDTLQSDRELARSLRMMQQYVDANPTDIYSTQMYGYVTTALDTVEESIRVYERTWQLKPEETQLLQLLSDAYMRKMDTNSALEALTRYENIEGRSNDISLKKMSLMLVAKDTLAAMKEVENLVSNDPTDPYSHILKGNL